VAGPQGLRGATGAKGDKGDPGPSTPGAGFVSSDSADVEIPLLPSFLEVGSLELPAGAYVVTAKLDFFYSTPAPETGGQSSVTCYLTRNGVPVDIAAATMTRSVLIGAQYTPAAFTTTIPLTAGVTSASPLTLALSCSRTYGVDADGMVGRNRKIVAVQVSSVTSG
jgi:hypothetical protein